MARTVVSAGPEGRRGERPAQQQAAAEEDEPRAVSGRRAEHPEGMSGCEGARRAKHPEGMSGCEAARVHVARRIGLQR